MLLSLPNTLIAMSGTERGMGTQIPKLAHFPQEKKMIEVFTNDQLCELRLVSHYLAGRPLPSPCLSFLISEMGTFASVLPCLGLE